MSQSQRGSKWTKNGFIKSNHMDYAGIISMESSIDDLEKASYNPNIHSLQIQHTLQVPINESFAEWQ